MVAPLPGDANQKTSRMDETSPLRPKQTLDKDLDKLVQVEEAATFLARGLVAPGIGLLFIVMAGVFAAIWVSGEPLALIIVMAAAIGGYMALNIGANDVANNVGPAVGARALTIGGALVIAAVFETAGALIAGGDVVETISRGIVAPEVMTNPMTFIWVMMSALIASALWINLATWIGAPVSTTHAIVGGVLGSGVAAAGFGSVDWTVVGAIAASWVISPVLGGVFAALVLAFIKVRIIYQDDKIVAARRWVPLLIGLMAGSFSAYLATKGLGHIIEPDGVHLALIGLACFLLGWGLSHIVVQRQSVGMENRNQSLRKLFRLPLICSAALLSFAHGANDVANAVGPLAAIVQAAEGGGVDAVAKIPLWVMLIGALGISVGLLLFGPKLIRLVGEQITKLNPMRAFCVALSAAITVIFASWFGMPVSSTHIAVGAVFGVGFFREWYTANSSRRRAYMERKKQRRRAERDLGAQVPESGNPPGSSESAPLIPDSSEEIARRKLVRRAHVTTVAAAWVTTVPAAALISGAIFMVLDALS